METESSIMQVNEKDGNHPPEQESTGVRPVDLSHEVIVLPDGTRESVLRKVPSLREQMEKQMGKGFANYAPQRKNRNPDGLLDQELVFEAPFSAKHEPKPEPEENGKD